MARPILSALFAVLSSGALLATATPAFGSYQAKPAEAASARFVSGDVLWRCGDAGCTAGASAARPAIVCSSLVKRVGRLDSFAVKGAALDTAALEKCNARAK